MRFCQRGSCWLRRKRETPQLPPPAPHPCPHLLLCGRSAGSPATPRASLPPQPHTLLLTRCILPAEFPFRDKSDPSLYDMSHAANCTRVRVEEDKECDAVWQDENPNGQHKGPLVCCPGERQRVASPPERRLTPPAHPDTLGTTMVTATVRSSRGAATGGPTGRPSAVRAACAHEPCRLSWDAREVHVVWRLFLQVTNWA